MINIEEIAREILEALEEQSLISKYKAEGVKLLYRTIVERAEEAKKNGQDSESGSPQEAISESKS